MDQNVLQMDQDRSENEFAVLNISSKEIGALSKEQRSRFTNGRYGPYSSADVRFD